MAVRQAGRQAPLRRGRVHERSKLKVWAILHTGGRRPVEVVGGLTWFANPPYGRGMEEFIRKCAEESSRSKGVLLVPARTDTGWFWKHVAPYARVEFIRGRLRFEVGGVPGQSAPFPSMLAFYGEEPNIAQFR